MCEVCGDVWCGAVWAGAYVCVFYSSPQLLILEWVLVVERGDRQCLLVTSPLDNSGVCVRACVCVSVSVCVRVCMCNVTLCLH